MKIKDPKVRKRVLDLVKSLAEEEAGDGLARYGLREAFSARPDWPSRAFRPHRHLPA